VQARWIEEDEEPEGVRGERGFTMPLSSDGKRTVQKFRTGKTKMKRVGAARPRALGEEEEMEEGDAVVDAVVDADPGGCQVVGWVV
jgi:hypothetical protein